MKKLLIVLGLILFASATGYQEIIDSKDAPIAKSVQSLIEMHMSGGEAQLQEISDLLYDIQAVIDQQQRNHDEFIEQNRNECESSLATYQTQLEKAEQVLEDSQGEQQDLNNEQSNKNQQLSDERINNESLVNDIAQAQDDLSAESNTWQEYKASFEDAIAACEEAIRLLTSLANGNASAFIQKNKGSSIMFVQMGQKFSDVQKILEKHVKVTGPASFVQPIIDVLSQMGNSNKVDVQAVVQVIELIQTLLQRLREGLFARESQNGQVTSDLNSLIQNLNSSLTSSDTTIEILENRLTQIAGRLEELAQIIVNTQEMIDAKVRLIEQTRADCQAEEDRYASETSSRNSDLAMLDRLIQYFEGEVVSNVSNVRDEALE